MRKCLLICGIAAVAALAQEPVFEVASIRSAEQLTPQMITSGKLHIGMKIDAGRVDIGYASLRDLVVQAYDVKPFQVTGPDWMTTARFDVLAKMPEGSTKEQVPAMLRKLLEERFKLVAHRENREQAVYSLEVGKGGPKFKEAPALVPVAEDAAPKPEAKGELVIGAGDQQIRVNRAAGGPGQTQTMSISTPQTGPVKVSVGANGQMRMEMERMTMVTLAQTLSPMLDRPVVDHTDLKGAYTIALELAMQDMMQMARTSGIGGAGGGGFGGGGIPGGFGGGAVGLGGAGGAGPTASDPSGGSIFQSVQQLGLKLEKQRAPIETVVVDSAEKTPTDN